MSDPLTFQITTVTVVPCDRCGADNVVTYWDDIRDGRWTRESFSCRECGHYHGEIDGNALDRGAANLLFVLTITGLALIVLGILGHSEWSWPLILGGGWLVAAVLVIALFVGAKQGDKK